MRRTLLSCSSRVAARGRSRPDNLTSAKLARSGVLGFALATLPAPVLAGELQHAIPVVFDLNRQEMAVLTTALALLGFSAVAAILLMRTRLRAARNEARLRADIVKLQAHADRYRALLFAEPQILIAWAAGDNRPRISGDTTLVNLQEQPQRVLAFGTWLPPEPALQMDHAVDTLRETGEPFLLNLTTANGVAVEAMGRAIGGQAVVRIRELSGLRRELAETNLRLKSLMEETEMLRGFASASPWPIWVKGAKGTLSYANPAYAQATDAKGVTDAIERNLELLDSNDRDLPHGK